MPRKKKSSDEVVDSEQLKRKRPDRAKKLQDKKTNKETVVKCCLLKYLYGDSDTKIKIQDAIDRRVLAFSQQYVIASLGYSYIARKVFENVEDVRNSELPELFFEQTFARQLMLGQEATHIENPWITSFIETYPQLYESIDRCFYDRNIYSAGARLLLTNIINHLQLNILSVIRRLNKKGTKHETIASLYMVLGYSMPDWLAPVFPQQRDFYDSIREQREILSLTEPNDKIDTPWTKDKTKLRIIMRYFIYANRLLKTRNHTLFNILPIAKVKRHYITIDSYVLYGIMTDTRLVDCSEKIFLEHKNAHWESLLKLNKLNHQSKKDKEKGKEPRKRFTGTVQTDGISMCVHFTRPKTAKDEVLKKKGKKGAEYLIANESIIINEGDRVIAIDPGRTNIIYAVEKVGNEYKVYVLTRNQYYTESGILDARDNTNKWLRNVKETMVAMSLVSTKDICTVAFERYMEAYLFQYDTLWSELSHTKWSRQRLRLYAGKQRVMDNFFNQIRKGGDSDKRIIIAYGTGCNIAGGKNEMSVPVSGIFKQCCQNFETKLTDEYRSTKVHHEDDSILDNIIRKDTGERLRGLLWCSSTNNNKFVNRDLNAAINILRCATSSERPTSLCHHHPKVVMKVGKVVKR